MRPETHAVRLKEQGLFHDLTPCNSARLNKYTSPDEGIHPHADGPVYFPRVVILSLGAPRVLRFERQETPGGPRSETQRQLTQPMPFLHSWLC